MPSKSMHANIYQVSLEITDFKPPITIALKQLYYQEQRSRIQLNSEHSERTNYLHTTIKNTTQPRTLKPY